MKRNAGLTMVELIVATCVSLILTVSLVRVLAPVYRTYQRTTAHADAQMIAGNMLDTLRTGARSASVVETDGSSLDIGKGVYSVQDGRLYFDETPIFANSYYDGKSVSLTFVQQGHNAVLVTVAVSGTDGKLAEASSVIMPMRSILDNDKASPIGMQELAAQLERDYQGTDPSPSGALFDDLYNNYYGGSWPVYDVKQIMTVEKLTQLRDAQTPQSASEAFFAKLLEGTNDTRTFYLATYYTSVSHLPVVYLTDSAASVFTAQRHGNVYLIYHEGNWYMDVSKADGFYMLTDTVLNNCPTAADLRAHLLDTNVWLDARLVTP